MPVEAIRYRDSAVEIIDQTRLPGEAVVIRLERLEALCEAIRALRVRGAPALGVAAAYGMRLVAERAAATGVDLEGMRQALRQAGAEITRTRPTARNLFGAVERLRAVVESSAASVEDLVAAVVREADAIHAEDRALCQAMAEHGAALLPQTARVLTHCNAGALATGGIGTALGVIYEAARQGKDVEVYADETRPLLQGARLTAWELQREGIPVTLLCDNAATALLASGRVHCVLVGADRIARNGDTANKIGTHSVALAAARYGVPFYVVAPSTTFDLSLESGQDIPIEERAASEVLAGCGEGTSPEGVAVFNPAFDVTPADLITAIVHEGGVVRAPYDQTLAASLSRPAPRGGTAPGGAPSGPSTGPDRSQGAS
jgi:methylthioribose-1-phosphate isomerase